MHKAPVARTSLLEVRAFLELHAAAPPAWSRGTEAVEALYNLLRTRAGDAAFWSDLTSLLERLDDARIRPRLLRGSDALGGAATAELVAVLRASLSPQGVGPASARSWAGSLPGAGALAAFLVLGTAMGCASDPGDEGRTDCTVAGMDGLEGEAAEVMCALAVLVGDASVSNYVRNELYDCLPGLGSARREQLLEQFQSLSAEELATALEDLAYSSECSPGDDDDDDDDDDH